MALIKKRFEGKATGTCLHYFFLYECVSLFITNYWTPSTDIRLQFYHPFGMNSIPMTLPETQVFNAETSNFMD